MKKLMIVAILLVAIVAGASWIFSQSGTTHTRHFTDLPWQITVNERQNLEVFGITLGESRLQDAVDYWGSFPAIGLFESDGGDQVVEAYFERVRLGPLDVKLIARVAISVDQMAAFNARRINRKPSPSGDFKYELIESDMARVLELAITEVTYIPKVKVDEDLLIQRFGKPAQQRTLKDQRLLLLYPEKGLAVILDENGRDIFGYTSPINFIDLEQRLLALD